MDATAWRNRSGQLRENGGCEQRAPFLIGVGGGTASGKSTVCEKIMEILRKEFDPENVVNRQVVHLSQGSFYKKLSEEEQSKAEKGLFNFDHPDAFDTVLMERCLQDLSEGKSTQIPTYDFKTNSRVPGEFITIDPMEIDVVLFEGILVFYFPMIREMFHMKLFVETDADSRLLKRVTKDTDELGRELEQVLHQYLTFVKPAYEEFCMPTKKFADVIIPRGADNKIAIDLISDHISELLSSPVDLNRRLSLMTEPRRRHFSDTSNIYDASRRITRPH